MDKQTLSAQSAALLFNVSGSRITVLMRAFGHPEQVRKALRAACSHRRTIIVSRPATFVGNAYAQLSKQAQDVAELLTTDDIYERSKEAYEWNYVIGPRGAMGAYYIKFSSLGKTAVEQPLMSFLGTEYKREYVFTEARQRALKGRPKERYLRNDLWKKITNLTPAQRARYERLAKAREAKARKGASEHQNITQAKNGIPLGLKDKPRKIHVDFTGVESVDRTRGESIRMYEESDYDQQYQRKDGAQP